METIGQRIKAIRLAQHIGQRELARRANINQGGLSMIEAGDREPSYPVLKALSRALGVPLTDLDPDLTEADFPNFPRAASTGQISPEVAALAS